MKLAIAVLCGIAICVAYVLSLCFRVGSAEERLFGRNHVLPLLPAMRHYNDPAVANSFGSPTYKFVRDGQLIHVYKPLINGFQHTYGSALCAYELGEFASDILFRMNEYFEAYTKKEGKSYAHYIDTKKDLANNAVGRKIAAQAKALHVPSHKAEEYLQSRVLELIANREVISHQLDARVVLLPNPDQYGCPMLPKPTY